MIREEQTKILNGLVEFVDKTNDYPRLKIKGLEDEIFNIIVSQDDVFLISDNKCLYCTYENYKMH